MLALFQWCILALYTESKTYNFALIIPKNYPIIPELFLILSTTYYSRNYSGIIDGSLNTYLITIFLYYFSLLSFHKTIQLKNVRYIARYIMCTLELHTSHLCFAFKPLVQSLALLTFSITVLVICYGKVQLILGVSLEKK